MTDEELGHVPIQRLLVCDLTPSPDNDKLYRPPDPNDPEFNKLVDSIAKRGVLDPLVVTLDGWIISGHRRHAAALQTAHRRRVPCRVLPFKRSDDPERFLRLLREFNLQRVKTRDERVREAVMDVTAEQAHRALRDYQTKQLQAAQESEMPALRIEGEKRRSEISAAKEPMLLAITQVLEEMENHWPLSDRQIHYRLLNNPPLRHASKPDSRYENTLQSYKSLVDLLTRARLVGRIPWHAIADETRPIVRWQTFREVGPFVERELSGLFRGYARELMQSQADHIEIVGEKNTVSGILRPVAQEFRIPLTTGRGYCSLPPRRDMAQRFERSGKDRLVVLMLSDFDPDGEEIAHSFARSMRDDFEVWDIHPVKVALTAEQVKAFNLPPVMTAKESSVHHGKFTSRHGENVFELEALPPADLQKILRDAIVRSIDVDAFNRELQAEREDARHLEGLRRLAAAALADANLTPPESEDADE